MTANQPPGLPGPTGAEDPDRRPPRAFAALLGVLRARGQALTPYYSPTGLPLLPTPDPIAWELTNLLQQASVPPQPLVGVDHWFGPTTQQALDDLSDVLADLDISSPGLEGIADSTSDVRLGVFGSVPVETVKKLLAALRVASAVRQMTVK
jgi:hypothetical protein